MIVFTVYKYAFYKFMKFAINADKDRKIAFRTPVLVSYITMIFLNFFHFLAVIPFFLPIGFLKNALFFIYLFVVLVVNFYLFININTNLLKQNLTNYLYKQKKN